MTRLVSSSALEMPLCPRTNSLWQVYTALEFIIPKLSALIANNIKVFATETLACLAEFF